MKTTFKFFAGVLTLLALYSCTTDDVLPEEIQKTQEYEDTFNIEAVYSQKDTINGWPYDESEPPIKPPVRQ
ncbi:hypothetical protein [Flavobacterium sp.]|uniref:hypothetical protein n=1 Tax=Flavobacterium sp. TaxID=239 RepID=UPI0028BD334D|nr:hypothetical protein [Flavobacterium sp.]